MSGTGPDTQMICPSGSAMTCRFMPVRHEAPHLPNGGGRPSSRECRSILCEAEGSLTAETCGRVGSSPDKAVTGRYRRMAWVRQATRKGVRKESAF